MEILGSMFAWVFNFIESKRAHAYTITILGLFVSFLLYHYIPLFFKFAYILKPDFQQYVLDHQLVFTISIIILISSPFIYSIRVTYYWLSFIYEQEARRGF